jgi:hypothetical protein
VSRIYFHTRTGTVAVLGNERAYLSRLIDDYGLAIVDGRFLRRASGWLTIDLYGKQPNDYSLDSDLESTAKLAFGSMLSSKSLAYQGTTLDPWILTLNTVMRAGSPALQFATRIHAQCEMQGYIEGPDRAVIADIVEAGIAAGIYRRTYPDGREPGWAKLVSMLRDDDTEPVVMSSSHGDQFPSPYIDMPPLPEGAESWRDFTEEQSAERGAAQVDLETAWEDLNDDQRWDQGVAGLRARPGFLRINPAEHDTYHYGQHSGLTWLDLDQGEQRTREVLGMDTALAGVTPTAEATDTQPD